MPKSQTLYVRKWPVDLARQVRAEAILKGISFREALIQAAQAWLKTKKKRR